MKKTTKVNKEVIPVENKPEVRIKKINVKKLHFILLALLILGGAGAYYKYGIVAIANGKYISRIEYIKNMEKQVGKQTLDQMISESLIMSEASKKNIKVEQSEIDAQIAKIDEQIKAQGQTLDAALTAEGMTKNDLEKQIRIQMLLEKLSDPKTEITQAQIDEFLKTNKDQLPAKATKEELQTLAKEQLASQAKNEAITNWLTNTKKDAKIIYN